MALESEETSAYEFQAHNLKFKMLYETLLSLERNQVVIDSTNYEMWSQMKELLFELLRMFLANDRKLDRIYKALADIHIALASLSEVNPRALLTREELVDRLKAGEPDEVAPPIPEADRPIGYYINVLRKATTPRAFQDQPSDDHAHRALEAVKRKIGGLKLGENIQNIQDVPPTTVQERMEDQRGLFQRVLDEMREKVNATPRVSYDARKTIEELQRLKKQRHPTPASEDTCLAHPAHYDPEKDVNPKERRAINPKRVGRVGEFDVVTVEEVIEGAVRVLGSPARTLLTVNEEPELEERATVMEEADEYAADNEGWDLDEYEPPQRQVRIASESDDSAGFVSTNPNSNNYAKLQKHDMEAIRRAQRDGWYHPGLVEGAPNAKNWPAKLLKREEESRDPVWGKYAGKSWRLTRKQLGLSKCDRKIKEYEDGMAAVGIEADDAEAQDEAAREPVRETGARRKSGQGKVIRMGVSAEDRRKSVNYRMGNRTADVSRVPVHERLGSPPEYVQTLITDYRSQITDQRKKKFSKKD